MTAVTAESAREVELLRRVADAVAVEKHLLELLNEDTMEALTDSLGGGELAAKVGALSSGVSALAHALDGSPGCLDPAEWNVKRRARVISYLESGGTDLPPVPQHWGRKVSGRCPLGCGETLSLGDGGHITCTHLECPNPTAVDEMLSPAAASQRQEEETAVKERFGELEARGEAIEGLVRTLLSSLEDSWWLRTAAVYNELYEIVVQENGP